MMNNQNRVHPLLCCIGLALSGAVGALAFAPVYCWPCAILSVLPLLWFSSQRKQSWLLGFSWGIGYFLSGVYWIYIVIQHFGALPIILAALILLLFVCYLALYPMLFLFVLSRYFGSRPMLRLIVVAPALWVLLDILRGIGILGFPWLILGYSQLSAPLHSFAPVFGVNGLTYLILLISGLIIYALQYQRYLSLLGIIAIFAASYALRLPQWVTQNQQKPLNIALVQSNIADTMNWDPNNLEHILQTYFELSLPYLGKSQLIVWPEGAIPDIQSNEYYFLSQLDQLGKQKKSTFILGIFSGESPKLYNSMIALGAGLPTYTTKSAPHYNKHHLVPFGEFTPFANWLQPLMRWFNIPMSDLSAGAYRQPPLNVQGFHFLPALCFDIIFNQQIQANFKPSDDFILLLSNDGWFGDSTAPWQHFQMSQMRALELGRPLLIDTTNGITAVIAANGQVIQQLPQFTQGVLATTVYPTVGETPFAYWGNWAILIIVLTALGSAVTLIRLQRHRSLK